ncbi:MAG: DNA-3-methyladenine glycosylase [Armatimonadetes bacterium]|nr:DNA-3-methyladenine glycosylase [Armatimonadota bacterium]
MKILDYTFYKRSTVLAAKGLLGKLLFHKTKEGMASGIIIETEAYLGENDPASHAARKKTPRNSAMFEYPGISYVYFIYGNHYCFNVVAHNGGAGAVLIRALEPYEGIELMRKRRAKNNLKELANGPGKLTQALKIEREHNKLSLIESNLRIYDLGIKIKEEEILKTSRIGIKAGKELPYRFFLKDNPYVSKK